MSIVMPHSKIETEVPISQERSDELTERLASAGQTLRHEELNSFLLYLSGDDGCMTAGCKGEIAFRSAHLSELWVDERRRGEGLGTALLHAAEAHAKEHGCHRLHLETRNEKARKLYERLGYHVFGTLEKYEGDNSFYYLEKRLD